MKFKRNNDITKPMSLADVITAIVIVAVVTYIVMRYAFPPHSAMPVRLPK